MPPRGRWREDGPAACTTYEVWLGSDPEPLEGEAVVERAASMVRRYLAAFGPAASADVRAWCGIAGLPAAVARLGQDLVRYRDERGRVAATWTTSVEGDRTRLTVTSLGAPVRSPAVEAEAERLLDLLVPAGGSAEVVLA